MTSRSANSVSKPITYSAVKGLEVCGTTRPTVRVCVRTQRGGAPMVDVAQRVHRFAHPLAGGVRQLPRVADDQ